MVFDEFGIDAIRDELSLCNSYTRLPTLMSMKTNVCPVIWLRLLGEFWAASDNIWEHTIEIMYDSPVTDRTGPIVEMMTESEAAELEVLFSQRKCITGYRGCYHRVNDDGHSYTTNREVAERFPFLNRYTIPGCLPILRVANIHLDDVVALKDCRDEKEIIVRQCNVLEDLLL